MLTLSSTSDYSLTKSNERIRQIKSIMICIHIIKSQLYTPTLIKRNAYVSPNTSMCFKMDGPCHCHPSLNTTDEIKVTFCLSLVLVVFGSTCPTTQVDLSLNARVDKIPCHLYLIWITICKAPTKTCSIYMSSHVYKYVPDAQVIHHPYHRDNLAT